MTGIYDAVSLAGIKSNLEHARQRRSKALDALINATLEVERLEEAIMNIIEFSVRSNGHETGDLRLEDVAMGDRYPTFDPDQHVPDLSINRETADRLYRILGPMEWRPTSRAYVRMVLEREMRSMESEGSRVPFPRPEMSLTDKMEARIGVTINHRSQNTEDEGFHASLITAALADPDGGSFSAGWESVSSGGFDGACASLTSQGVSGGDELAIKWAQKGAV